MSVVGSSATHPLPLFSFFFLLTLLTTLTTTNSLPQRQLQQPQATKRPYTNHTFLGAHDSPFAGPLPTQNQNLNVTAQLDLGIRFLQAQTHVSHHGGNNNNESVLQLCHTSCLLEDAGPLVDYLRLVKGWLESEGHESETVSLLLTNGDRVEGGMFENALAASGLRDMVYVPGDGARLAGWPSLDELVEMGKRVVVFLDYGASPSITPSILDEFTYFFETAFGVTDPTFSDCSIHRPPGLVDDGRMCIVNHFLDVEILGGIKVPDREHADRTNAKHGNGSIGDQAGLCAGLYGRRPNVVLVNFVEMGDVNGGAG